VTATPQIGQHSREVLRECGLSDAALDTLAAAGAIHQA
jgi:crotonobetainyl-CoA:carnitine CoA-transferase CaiB-like acyl-CoA transferase